MKDKNGLHFLGWAILANVTPNKKVAIVCAAIAGVYALIGIYESWKNRRSRK